MAHSLENGLVKLILQFKRITAFKYIVKIIFSHWGLLGLAFQKALQDWCDKARKIVFPSLFHWSKITEKLLFILFIQLILLFISHFGPQRYCSHLHPSVHTYLAAFPVCLYTYVSRSPLSVKVNLEGGGASGTRTKQSLGLLFGWSGRGNR